MSKQASWNLNGCRPRGIARIGALLALPLAVAGVAQAQTAATPAPAKAEDSSLTWKGITLYGIIDIGLQYQTHGTPISDYFPAGTAEPLQKNSNGSVTAVTPSNLSQSRIGLAGNEPIPAGYWAGSSLFEQLRQAGRYLRRLAHRSPPNRLPDIIGQRSSPKVSWSTARGP